MNMTLSELSKKLLPDSPVIFFFSACRDAVAWTEKEEKEIKGETCGKTKKNTLHGPLPRPPNSRS